MTLSTQPSGSDVTSRSVSAATAAARLGCSERDEKTRIWTIGHSTRDIGELLALLRENAIAAIADVRRFPASRRHPQFAREALEASLRAAGIEYHWLPELGGRRTPRKDSPNTAWRNEGFRGYADYMQTEAFHLAIAGMLELARDRRTAYLCAEQAWQQCHRGLISDSLKAQRWEVIHIVGPERTLVHPYTDAASIIEGELNYAAGTPRQTTLGW